MKTLLRCFGDLKLCPRRRAVARQRDAITLLEITAAATILAVLMTISVQMLRAVGGQHRATERRALALATVQGIAEQIGNIPWEELTTEAARKVGIPAAAQLHLPGSRLAVAVQDEQEPVAAKRVTIRLEWNGPNGRANAPVRLTTWVFPVGLQEN